MSGNKFLHAANKAKQDEFYTQLSDIEKELKHYRGHFYGKTIYCNCDDPTVSNFYRYFELNFAKLGLKTLISTCYRNQQYDLFSTHDKDSAVGIEYTGEDTPPYAVFPLNGYGDFRSQECIEILKKSDVVVTNPPFSLFREYVAQLIEHNKKFLIIGNMNAITYKEIFPMIRDQKIWLGVSIKSGDREFGVPDHYPLNAATSRVDDLGRKFIRVKGVRWFTNLEHERRNEELILTKKYCPDDYPKYDNYDAINVSKTADIPCDYDGEMGVPISFLDKHNPNQFEIVSADDIRANDTVPFKFHGLIKDKDGAINGKPTYVRIVIRNKRIRQ